MAALVFNTMSCGLALCDTSTNPEMKWRLCLTCPVTFKKLSALMRPNISFFFCSYSSHSKTAAKALLLMCFQEQSKFIECSFVSLLSTDARRKR